MNMSLFYKLGAATHVCLFVCLSQEHLNKTVYTNKPTKDYSQQFNTGSR